MLQKFRPAVLNRTTEGPYIIITKSKAGIKCHAVAQVASAYGTINFAASSKQKQGW